MAGPRFRQQAQRGRAAAWMPAEVERPGRRQRLGRRVSPRHLAAAPPGHQREGRRDPGLRRHPPAVAEGPGQALGPVAAVAPGPGGRRRPSGRCAVLTRLAAFLAARGITGAGPGQPGRCSNATWPTCTPSIAGRPGPRRARSASSAAFLTAIRRHGWDAGPAAGRDALPRATSRTRRPSCCPGRWPSTSWPRSRTARQPRPVGQPRLPADHPHPDPLRAAHLRRPEACPSTARRRRRQGAPYLRYCNHKMKREALVPIDEELAGPDPRPAAARPGPLARRDSVLFPRPAQEPGREAHRSAAPPTGRRSTAGWNDCDVRDEHGQPVHLTPHQWRHTLGTVLINRDVPQHVVQKILDHDSPP